MLHCRQISVLFRIFSCYLHCVYFRVFSVAALDITNDDDDNDDKRSHHTSKQC